MTKYLPLNKVIPLMLIYCIVSVIGIYHHELWLDDVQHWLVARDSMSFIDLFKNYDDHVPLWKILLFFLIHFISANPFAIQVFHIIVINIAVFIFLRHAPFNFAAKILVIFGYYFVFEYSILCRNYALGILFLFTVCTLLSNPERNLIKIGVLLILMCSTHEFFIFASISFFLYMVCYNYEHKSLNKRFYAFTFLFVVAFIVPVLRVLNIPANDADLQQIRPSWFTVHNVSFAIHGIDKGFIPFPPLHDPNFLNRHLFEDWSSYIKVPLSLFFLAFPVWVIKNSRKALIFYITACLFMLLFLTASQMAASRHYGMFFIFFITAIWLADFDGANVLFIDNAQKRPLIKIVAASLFYLILFTQVLAGAYIYEQDYTRPFSQAKNTVKFICDRHLGTLPLIVDGYGGGPALSAYSGHPLYYLDIDATGSELEGNKALNTINRRSLMNAIEESKYLQSLKEFILVTNRNNAVNDKGAYSFYKFASFEDAIIASEDYYVYRVTK